MNKKILVGTVIAIVIIVGIIGGLFYKNSKNDVDSEVIEIIKNLNSKTSGYGDWNPGLHITKVNKVKKIDVKLLYDGEKNEIDKNSEIFIMNLEERSNGNIEIVVVNGRVTANSLLGETVDDLWNRNIFTKDKINVEKINKEIK